MTIVFGGFEHGLLLSTYLLKLGVATVSCAEASPFPYPSRHPPFAFSASTHAVTLCRPIVVEGEITTMIKVSVMTADPGEPGESPAKTR